MWIDTAHARVGVTTHRALRLERALGTRLRAVHGTVWITIDNDPRDIVLDPGEDFVIDTPHSLVVLPLGERKATLDVCGSTGERAVRAVASQGTPRPRWHERVQTWLHERLAVRPA